MAFDVGKLLSSTLEAHALGPREFVKTRRAEAERTRERNLKLALQKQKEKFQLPQGPTRLQVLRWKIDNQQASPDEIKEFRAISKQRTTFGEQFGAGLTEAFERALQEKR